MVDIAAPLPCEAVLQHVVDVHCHPTDAPSISSDSMHRLHITICSMATRQSDQAFVRDFALSCPQKVVPCFGHHPWFSHLITTQQSALKEEHYRQLFLPSIEHIEIFNELLATLPDPIPLGQVLSSLRDNLQAFPNAMLGEVGLDRSFRVAIDYFASSRRLTPFNIPIEHQMEILEAQLDLAVELGRNISFHSVKSQKATIELLEKMCKKYGERWIHISIDMHSCGLSPEIWIELEKKHPNVFLSLSTVINGRSLNHRNLIAVASPRRLLAESDFNDIEDCTQRTWDMIHIIAQIKGWEVEKEWIDDLPEEKWGVVRRLENNWKEFVKGHHQQIQGTNRATRKMGSDWQSDESDA